MTPTVRSQNESECIPVTENRNRFLRGQNGISRNNLGNRLKKPILSEYKENQIVSKHLFSLYKKGNEKETSKSSPDLTRTTRIVRPKISSVLSASNSLQNIKSCENLTKPRKTSVEKSKIQQGSRIPNRTSFQANLKQSLDLKKTKRIEIGKKTILEKSRSIKAVENKRKFGCIETNSNQAKHKLREPEFSSSSFPRAFSSNSHLEDCKKIVKKILLDKKILEMSERKKSSCEFDDSVRTFNSDEMADFLLSDTQLKQLESSRISSEMDKSSKRNSSEFEDSIGSFFSDQMVLSMSKSTEFLNASCSKQNFLNDNPINLSISEDLDNLTPGILSNVMDRTPSAEDLPMECDVEQEAGNSTLVEPNVVVGGSTSPIEELPQGSLSLKTPNTGLSIITSITSTMSLDTGYQGDGELSRPESRNTENESRLLKLPIAENELSVKANNVDDGKTMTDSDFFTESDVDVHDDLSAAAAEIGSGKGDRKAQVINGTLYGSSFAYGHSSCHTIEQNVNVPENRLISVANNSNEDMESSGIYSDFEKKPEEFSSQKKQPISYLDKITEQMRTIQNLALLVAEKKSKQEFFAESIVKSSSGESSSTVYEVLSSNKGTDNNTGKTVQTDLERKDSLNKKLKVPHKNVPSKIKMIIDAPKKETETKTKIVKKGKWDDVMDKIAQGKEENKYKPSKFRDIKSKVFQNMEPIFNSRRNDIQSKIPPKVSPGSQLKSRSRRNTRLRSSESSLISPKSKQSRTNTSVNSSQRSSLSDISLSENTTQKSKSGSKKRDSISPQSNESTNSTHTPIRKIKNNESTPNGGNTLLRNSDINNENVLRNSGGTPLPTMKTPVIRKTPTVKRGDAVGPILQRTASVPLKDSNHNGIVSKSGSAVIINNNNNTTIQKNNNNSNNNKLKSNLQNRSLLKSAANGPDLTEIKNNSLLAAAKDTNKALLKQLKYNGKAFDSLLILFSYCINDLEAFSISDLKLKLEEEKRKFLIAQDNIEKLQSKIINLKEELNDKDATITELNNDKINLSEESDNFRKLVEDLKEKLQIVTEEKCEAENELLRECENIRCLRRELSNRIENFESEKDSLICCLSKAKKENGILKSANREIKEEYDKCLLENQRLVELISKRQNEVMRVAKENTDSEEINTSIHKSKIYKEGSPDRISISTEKHQKNSSISSPSINPNCLEDEVESLRQVLALKTDEVTELRRQELSLRENADRVPKLLSTITMLEGKVEDLQTQLSSQTETVRDLFKSNDHLTEELKSANIQKTRLMHKNEELQYKLKQYAEAMKQLATQKNLAEKSIKNDVSPLKSNQRKNENHIDDLLKSQMKGVVEKSDSMSYMLEMTEDSAEIVTNIIKRAESLRTTSRDSTLPKKRRSKALSLSSNDNASIKRYSSSDNDFKPEFISTPYASPQNFEFDRHFSSPKDISSVSPNYAIKKVVKLNQDDFSVDSIEVANENECEIIEITKNFDRIDKNSVLEMSTSSTSTSSSNESHFDIESDVFCSLNDDQNFHDLYDDKERSEFQENNSSVKNTELALPVYTDLNLSNYGHSIKESNEGVQSMYETCTSKFVKIPKNSGGEAMVTLSSDEEDFEKVQRIGNE